MKKIQKDKIQINKNANEKQVKNDISKEPGFKPLQSQPVVEGKAECSAECEFDKKLASVGKMLRKAEPGTEQEEVRIAISILDIKMPRNFHSADLLDLIELIVMELFKKHSKSPALTEVIDAFADMLIKVSDRYNFNHWSHNICHLFEGYVSIFDIESLSPSAEKLISHAVDKASVWEIGCIPRILGPLVEYNIIHLSLSNLDGSFPFKPDSLCDKNFLEKLKKQCRDPEIILFCSSTTPREFIERIEKDVSEMEYNESILRSLVDCNLLHLSPDNLDGSFPFKPDSLCDKNFLEKLKKQCRDPEIILFCSSTTPREFLELIEEKFDPVAKIQNYRASKNRAETVDGLFVDVDGTLIIDGKLNEYVYSRLKLKAERHRVTIFTGGDPEAKSIELRELGVSEDFLPVRSKSDYFGKMLGEVWDDTNPKWQGFDTFLYCQPRNVW